MPLDSERKSQELDDPAGWVDRYGDRLLSSALNRVGSRDTAEDLGAGGVFGRLEESCYVRRPLVTGDVADWDFTAEDCGPLPHRRTETTVRGMGDKRREHNAV